MIEARLYHHAFSATVNYSIELNWVIMFLLGINLWKPWSRTRTPYTSKCNSTYRVIEMRLDVIHRLSHAEWHLNGKPVGLFTAIFAQMHITDTQRNGIFIYGIMHILQNGNKPAAACAWIKSEESEKKVTTQNQFSIDKNISVAPCRAVVGAALLPLLQPQMTFSIVRY